MGDYNVALEAAWVVRNIDSVDDAVSIAISEMGKRLNPKLDYVDFDVGLTSCPYCGQEFQSVFMITDTALVGLVLDMKVYNAENEDHASRIAKSVIGKAISNVPLRVVEVSEMM